MWVGVRVRVFTCVCLCVGVGVGVGVGGGSVGGGGDGSGWCLGGCLLGTVRLGVWVWEMWSLGVGCGVWGGGWDGGLVVCVGGSVRVRGWVGVGWYSCVCGCVSTGSCEVRCECVYV